MRPTHLIAVIPLSFVLTATTACRPDHEREIPPRAEAAAPLEAERSDDPVTVTGCLTAGPAQKNFVLTAEADPMTSTTVRTAAGTAPTYTYELVGGDNLGQHLNRQVTVRGRLDEEKDRAEFEQTQRSRDPGQTPDGDTPTVTSTEEVEVRVRRIFIESVSPTAQDCDSTAR